MRQKHKCNGCKGTGISKSFGGSDYLWYPNNDIVIPSGRVSGTDGGSIINKSGCTAKPYSVNGEDYNTDYVALSETINGVQFRYAYAACGYVQ